MLGWRTLCFRELLYNGLTFEAFVVCHLVPKLWEGACVIMDNCTIHQGEEIRRAIEQA
jgi:hypothetical protein